MVAGALAVLAGVGIGDLLWNHVPRPNPTATSTRGRRIGPLPSTTAAGPRDTTAPGSPPHPARIAAHVDPGLVDVNTVLGYQTAEAAGTGMVLSPTGEVLTNNHVIEGATRITATDLATHRTYRAVVVGVVVTTAAATTRPVGTPAVTITTTTTPTPPATAPVGVPVLRVLPSTPAAEAGVAPGDVLTEVTSTPVRSPDQLAGLIGQHHPADTLTVAWSAPTGSTSSATVMLATGPAG